MATSAEATGPFVDVSEGPLVCQHELGGSSDPNPFVVNGQPYLAWKSDGNCCGLATVLWSAPLDADGTTVGEPAALLESSEAWENGVVEGPSLFELDGTLHLLYSANRWDTDRYGIGHAVCDGPLGPCRRSSPDPWLTSHAEAAGPGGQAVVPVTESKAVMLYHAWPADADGMRCAHEPHRVLYATGVELDGSGELHLIPICTVPGGCG